MSAMKTISCSRAKKGFTLIELLLVISVMAILLLFTVPAFQDIGRGSRMRSAINQLTSTLNLARQWAITKREDVYILFPDDHAGLYAGAQEHKDKALRSYVVVSPSQGFITEWRYLPAGIYFVDPYNSSNFKQDSFFDAAKNVFRAGTLERLPFPEMSSGTKLINTLRFKKDGSVSNAGLQPSEVYLAEAAFAEANGSEPLDITWKTVGNEGSVIRAISISPFTGLSRVIDSTQMSN